MTMPLPLLQEKEIDAAIRIMIVEDEAIVAESLNDQLIELGYEICGMADSGEDALSLADSLNPHLVMMDIMLAGEMDGVETAERILRKSDIPVIYLTAYSDKETLERAKITQPFGYLIKPYKERELHTTIEVSLYRFRMEKRIRDHERWLETLMNSIGEGIVTVGLNGRVTNLSSVAEKLLGWKEEEACGKELQEILPLEQTGKYPIVPDLIDQALDGENVSYVIDDDPVLTRRDGERIMIDATAAAIRADANRIVGAVLTIRNVTARKQAEMELAEARNLLNGLLTVREKEILRMIVNGSTTKEIGYDLVISPRTVEAHRRNMMAKLQVSDMPMLVRCAVTHQLVPLD